MPLATMRVFGAASTLLDWPACQKVVSEIVLLPLMIQRVAMTWTLVGSHVYRIPADLAPGLPPQPTARSNSAAPGPIRGAVTTNLASVSNRTKQGDAVTQGRDPSPELQLWMVHYPHRSNSRHAVS